MNNSMAAMMNSRVQPSPAALNPQQVKLLNQNTANIDEFLTQQQNFAKNYNNSTALSKYTTHHLYILSYLIDSL